MLVNERPENRRNPEFDNEASLREARKKLPFELFLEQHGSAESCVFCQPQGSVKVITRPVVTGKISRATIEAVNAIEIVRVVEPRVPLKKNKACCPFHPEKSPGFNVVPRKNRFHCFGCPKSGGPINFIREFCHLDFLPAVEHLAKEFGVPIVHATRGQETVFKGTNPGGTSGTWQEGDEWDEMDVLVGESQLAVWEGRKALTRTEAFMVFLKEAGVWKDRGRFKPNRGNIEHPTSNAEHPMNAAPSPPLGVCAIPGTTFAKNFELREELHAWLYAVKCHQVVVALDDQDKSDRPMRDRHEALIWSQYLANDLMNKLPLQAKVCAAEGLAR